MRAQYWDLELAFQYLFRQEQKYCLAKQRREDARGWTNTIKETLNSVLHSAFRKSELNYTQQKLGRIHLNKFIREPYPALPPVPFDVFFRT